jgi:hypothetical protein
LKNFIFIKIESKMSSLTENELNEVLSHPVHDKMEDFKNKTFKSRLVDALSEKDKNILNIIYEKMLVEYLGESYSELKKKADSFKFKMKRNEPILNITESPICSKYIQTAILNNQIHRVSVIENNEDRNSIRNIEYTMNDEIFPKKIWVDSDYKDPIKEFADFSLCSFFTYPYKYRCLRLESYNLIYYTFKNPMTTSEFHFRIKEDLSTNIIYVKWSDTPRLTDLKFLFIFKDYNTAEKFINFFDILVDTKEKFKELDSEVSLKYIKEKFEEF